MSNENLNTCPACGAELEVAGRRGDYLDLTCGFHGNFRASTDVLIMVNNSAEKMNTLRQWVESGRASSFEGVICTYDLWPSA